MMEQRSKAEPVLVLLPMQSVNRDRGKRYQVKQIRYLESLIRLTNPLCNF